MKASERKGRLERLRKSLEEWKRFHTRLLQLQARNPKTRIKGENLLHWISKSESHIATLENAIKKHTESGKTYLAVGLAVFLAIVFISGFFLFLRQGITGLAVLEEPAQGIGYSLPVGKTFSENSEYAWVPAVPGNLLAVKLTGAVVGEGPARVYLGFNGTRLEILSLGQGESFPVSAPSEAVKQEDFVPAQDISVKLAYNSGSAFDQDDNGVESVKGVVDFDASGTEFSIDAKVEGTCTRWEIENIETAESSYECYGSESCCNVLGFIPSAPGWDDAYNVFVGKNSAGNDNIVRAQVVYYDEADDSVYSGQWAELPASFVEPDIRDFSLECKDTCNISLPGENYSLVFEVDDSAVTIDRIDYVMDTDMDQSQAGNESGKGLSFITGLFPDLDQGWVENASNYTEEDLIFARYQFHVDKNVIHELERASEPIRVIVKYKTPSSKKIGEIAVTDDIDVAHMDKTRLSKLTGNKGIEKVYLDQPVSLLFENSSKIIMLGEAKEYYLNTAYGLQLDGSGIKICALDTGVNPSVVQNTAYGYNVLAQTNDYQDDNGHGTLVSYITYMMAPAAQLIAVKVLDSQGIGYESDILAGLEYCKEQNVDIISMSIGAGGYTGICYDNPVAQKVDELSGLGILTVAAAGNTYNNTIVSPACAETALPVGASTENDRLSALTSSNNAIVLLAPGEDIDSVDHNANAELASGTSISAAFVSGGAALVYQYNDSLDNAQMKKLLIATGSIINEETVVWSRLNIYNAITNNITNNFTGIAVNGTGYDTQYRGQGVCGSTCTGVFCDTQVECNDIGTCCEWDGFGDEFCEIVPGNTDPQGDCTGSYTCSGQTILDSSVCSGTSGTCGYNTGTTCSGTCASQCTAGYSTCQTPASGQEAANCYDCKECDGAGTCNNIANATKDTVGTTCSGTCRYCSGSGTCTYANANDDPNNDCSATNTSCASVCVTTGRTGFCTGGAASCATTSYNNNIGTYCSGSGTTVTGQCNNTDFCSSETFYGGQNCSGAGYCTISAYLYDRDTNESLCTSSASGCTSTYNWSIGGEGSYSTCCGDDSNENTIIERNYSSSSELVFVNAEDACCSATSDCVAGESCFTPDATPAVNSNSAYNHLNLGGNDSIGYCYSSGGTGTWLQCDTSDYADYWCGYVCGREKGVISPRSSTFALNISWNAAYAGESNVGEYPDTSTLGCCGDDLTVFTNGRFSEYSGSDGWNWTEDTTCGAANICFYVISSGKNIDGGSWYIQADGDSTWDQVMAQWTPEINFPSTAFTVEFDYKCINDSSGSGWYMRFRDNNHSCCQDAATTTGTVHLANGSVFTKSMSGFTCKANESGHFNGTLTTPAQTNPDYYWRMWDYSNSDTEMQIVIDNLEAYRTSYGTEYNVYDRGGVDVPTGYNATTNNTCCRSGTSCGLNNTCYDTGEMVGAIPTKAYCHGSFWMGGDSTSEICTAITGGSNWDLGGDVTATACCGDDSGENGLSRTCDLGSCTTSSSDRACCNEASKCVYDSACYANNVSTDPDSDGILEVCLAGTWYDGDKPNITFDYTNDRNGSYISRNWTWVNVTVFDNSTNVTAFFDWNKSLVLWLRFNNETGENDTYFRDWSSYENNATCVPSSCPVYAEGKMGRGMEFDGAVDRIVVPADASLNFSYVTYSLWFKVRNQTQEWGGTNQTQIIHHGLWGNGNGVQLFDNPGSVIVRSQTYIGSTNYYSSSVTLDHRTYHHIAWTYNGTHIRTYIDGRTITITAVSGVMDASQTNNSIFIGGTQNGAWRNFPGFIDDVKIFNRPLSPEEINATYNASVYSLYRNFTDLVDNTSYNFKAYVQDRAGNVNATELIELKVDKVYPQISFDEATESNGLITTEPWAIVNVSVSDDYLGTAFVDFGRSLKGWWRFNRESGENSTFARDWSTYGNNGTVFSGSTTSGRFGSGVLLHGTTSSWVNLSRSAMDGLNNFTVEFWAKSSDTSKSGTPIHGSSATGNNEFLIFNYGASVFIKDASFSTGVTLNDGDWHHIVILRDGDNGTVYMYKDGVPKISKNMSNGSLQITGCLVLGQEEDAACGGFDETQAYLGILDEVKIWNRIISIQEINASYRAGTYKLYQNYTSLSPGAYPYTAYVQDLAGNLNQTSQQGLTVQSPLCNCPSSGNWTLSALNCIILDNCDLQKKNIYLWTYSNMTILGANVTNAGNVSKYGSSRLIKENGGRLVQGTG
ncbi:MAG: hypothetical protein QS98_C0005G0071 [archaeon GW2011_AR3]|nr:MAG: hypothetical protein QS98_C0005G0071 [archaeon GW2011_AR3]MBS3109424.1 S8 family serine peptidase [Candidatus Woesearchaeota archaeon]